MDEQRAIVAELETERVLVEANSELPRASSKNSKPNSPKSGAQSDARSNFLSGLLETDAIVLHCDERYQHCGGTACVLDPN